MQHLILIHGALGSQRDLHFLSEEIKKEGFQTHLLSFSGHDQQAFQSDFGIEQFSEELKKFIEDKHMHRPNIFGYSMGGYVALQTASQHKDLIGKIITLGTKFEWTVELAQKESRNLEPAALLAKVPHFAEELHKKHGDDWQELVKRTAQMINNLGARALLNSSTLKDIENAVLLGRGDNDRLVNFEETQNAGRVLPDAGLYILPHTAHGIETANIFILSKIISEFLKSD